MVSLVSTLEVFVSLVYTESEPTVFIYDTGCGGIPY